VKKRETFAAEVVSEALIDAVSDRWRRFRRNLRRLGGAITTKAVHDERTASRRLLSVLGVLEPLVGRRLVRDVQRELKRILGALGPLRDVHIELGRTRRWGSGSRIPQFRRYLEREERGLRKKARRRSRRVRAGRMRGSIRQIEGRLRRLGRSSGWTSGPALDLLRAIDRDFERVLEVRRALDPADPASLHRLRIAIKKFRYTVEALEPVLRGFARSHLDQLHLLQTRLGDLHDLEMMSGAFRDFLRKTGNGVPQLFPLQKRLLDEHYGELREALATMDGILEFWEKWKAQGQARLWIPAENGRASVHPRRERETA
jgi:CHAD domain-containing protein